MFQPKPAFACLTPAAAAIESPGCEYRECKRRRTSGAHSGGLHLSTKSAVEVALEEQQHALAPRDAILRMAASAPIQEGRRNKLRLDMNENTVGGPPHVLDFLKRYITAADLSIYPEYGHALEDLARHFAVEPGELTLTNGATEAIQLVLNTYVDQGDEVLILRPSYPAYAFFAQLAGANINAIDYCPRDLAFPLEQLCERITPSTRAILIGNPNNPTGTGADTDALAQILAKASNAAVLIDEAYYEFSGITMLPSIAAYPNLFVSRTFSTIYGMAAMRCGCLFSRAANMSNIRTAQSPYSVNSLAAMAMRIAVEGQRFVEEYALEVLTARELLYVGLERLNIAYIESQANFVLLHLDARAPDISGELRNRGILVTDCSDQLPGYLRVTVGTRDQVQQFLIELEQIW